jgi:hypothetical protein
VHLVSGSAFRVDGFRCGVKGFGFRGKGVGSRVWDSSRKTRPGRSAPSAFGVWVLGLRVQGVGSGV